MSNRDFMLRIFMAFCSAVLVGGGVVAVSSNYHMTFSFSVFAGVISALVTYGVACILLGVNEDNRA